MNEKLMYMYSILDVTSGDYGIPVMASNDEVAKRNAKILGLDDETLIGQFPKDFKLFRIGTYNTGTAELVSEKPFLLGSIAQLLDAE